MTASNGVVAPGALASEVEVLAKTARRRFSAGGNLQILRAVETCTQPGEIGRLLHRAGPIMGRTIRSGTGRQWKTIDIG